MTDFSNCCFKKSPEQEYSCDRVKGHRGECSWEHLPSLRGANDAELLALAAVVTHDAANMNYQTARYNGDLQTAPDFEAAATLRALLEKRGVFKQPERHGEP